MVFVVDDLGAWLVALVADAGRKKLLASVFGTEQERALRQAAAAAVQYTADELGGSDEQAGQVAMVITEVFCGVVPELPVGGDLTLLGALQGQLMRLLAVLDDAGLTGTGQSPASVLGIAGTDVAERLTGHLVREIVLRGSRGGPLTPLASQVNFDRLQDAMGQMTASSTQQHSAPGRTGWPLVEVTDPFALEVHRPVEADDPGGGLAVLPLYVPREHDVALAELVKAAAAGRSGVAVLVGGSSTGKTRACWEALNLLRDREPGWRLWHPIDPSRPEAALRELPGIGPRTVVWLNEAQFYLGPAGGAGERVAAGLRELLRTPDRAPVLVLATLWPMFWDELTAPPPRGEDQHAQARELLTGHDITVPAAFTPAQLRQLESADDPRMVQAVAGATDGQVVQYLAGAPELLARYRNAPPAARAVIEAAIDARRLGMRPAVPLSFLRMAAPGYLSGTDWDQLDEDWLEQALAYAARPCKGIRGPVTRIRPRPGQSLPPPAIEQDGPAYQLADYLDQAGRRARIEMIPPESFWGAAAAHAHTGDLDGLGDAAYSRGLYQHAAQLHKNATTAGNAYAAASLARHLHQMDPSNPAPARYAAAHAALGDPRAIAELLRVLQEAGAHDQAQVLLDRDPAAHAALDDSFAVAELLRVLREAGAHNQAHTLATRAATHTALGNLVAVADLLRVLQEAGAHDQAHTLATRAATLAPLDDPDAMTSLLHTLREAGAHDQACTLATRAAIHMPLNRARAVDEVLRALREAGAHKQAYALATRAATHALLDPPEARGWLLRVLQGAGAHDQVRILTTGAATGISLNDPGAVAMLLDVLLEVGAHDQVQLLLDRDPATHAAHGDSFAVTGLLRMLRETRADGQVHALATRAAADTTLDNPRAVASMLWALRDAGMHDQVQVLLDRDPATHTTLADPFGVASLLQALRDAEAHHQVQVLLDRDPATHTTLDNLHAVDLLLRVLRKARAYDQVHILATWAVAYITLDHPEAVTDLLQTLREVGTHDQIHVLATRAATDTPLDPPEAMAGLLQVLREAGAHDQLRALATRAAAHTTLDNPRAVASVLDGMRKARVADQADVLIGRLPAAGLFTLYRKQDKDNPDRYRFGQDATNHPAPPWNWQNLT